VPRTVLGSITKEILMIDNIAVAGVIGTNPQVGTTSQGTPFVNFRLASNTRRLNHATGKWEDAGTNWYSVAAYRHLARNLGRSLRLGEHVIVAGRLRVNEWTAGEKSGIKVEIVADAVGHDLTWGTSVFTRAELSPTGSAATQTQPHDVSADAGAWSVPGASESDETPQLVSG